MDAGKSAPAWRSAAVAICLLPVVLPLALRCLPLLCLAIAVSRFRSRRRLRRAAKKTSGCFFGGEWPSSTEREEDGEGAWRRVALLQKCLEDQMELVGGSVEADKRDDSMAAQAKKVSAPIELEHQELS